MFIGGGLILAGVMLLLLHALRRKESAVRPGRWIIGLGIVFPVAVLAALMGYSQWRSAALRDDPPPGALIISITGHMWWWEVRYSDPSGGADIVLANELRIPTGRPIWLGLTSADVIHSVWLPSLAGKMDTVPGRVNRLVFSADKPGVYRGQCAEFCGEQHARMALHLVAHAPAEFDSWLRAQAAPAAAPATAQQQAGLAAFLAQRCDACHTVRGVSEGGRLGPDLTHIGSRLTLAAGTLENNTDTMAHWIRHTQQVKPGARMPSHAQLDAGVLDALAAYLGRLQ